MNYSLIIPGVLLKFPSTNDSIWPNRASRWFLSYFGGFRYNIIVFFASQLTNLCLNTSSTWLSTSKERIAYLGKFCFISRQGSSQAQNKLKILHTIKEEGWIKFSSTSMMIFEDHLFHICYFFNHILTAPKDFVPLVDYCW